MFILRKIPDGLLLTEYPRSESTNSTGSKSRRSYSDSPTPISFTGTPRSLTMLTTKPPLAVPSSFVTTRAEIPTYRAGCCARHGVR